MGQGLRPACGPPEDAGEHDVPAVLINHRPDRDQPDTSVETIHNRSQRHLSAQLIESDQPLKFSKVEAGD